MSFLFVRYVVPRIVVVVIEQGG